MKTFTVGRGDEADVNLQDESISRVHLVVEVINNSQVKLNDLNSTNGSYLLRNVGKISLSDKQVVNVYDRILIGDYETTVEALLNLMPNTTTSSPLNDTSGGTTQSDDAVYSRYIRGEDGRFVRKPQ